MEKVFTSTSTPLDLNLTRSIPLKLFNIKLWCLCRSDGDEIRARRVVGERRQSLLGARDREEDHHNDDDLDDVDEIYFDASTTWCRTTLTIPFIHLSCSLKIDVALLLAGMFPFIQTFQKTKVRLEGKPCAFSTLLYSLSLTLAHKHTQELGCGLRLLSMDWLRWYLTLFGVLPNCTFMIR